MCKPGSIAMQRCPGRQSASIKTATSGLSGQAFDGEIQCETFSSPAGWVDSRPHVGPERPCPLRRGVVAVVGDHEQGHISSDLISDARDGGRNSIFLIVGRNDNGDGRSRGTPEGCPRRRSGNRDSQHWTASTPRGAAAQTATTVAKATINETAARPGIERNGLGASPFLGHEPDNCAPSSMRSA